MLSGIPLPLIIGAVGVILLLLLVGAALELKGWRDQEKADQKDMRRNAGWRGSSEGFYPLLVGLGAGIAAAFLLVDPLAELAVSRLVGPSAGAARLPGVLIIQAALAAAFLLVSGPLSVTLVGPRTPAGRRWVGGLASAAAFGLVGGLVGLPLIGLLLQPELARLALTNIPYSEARWLNALGMGLQSVFTWSAPAWVLLTGLGGLLGVLLGGLAPGLDSDRPPVSWTGALLLAAGPGLAGLAVTAVVIYALLGPAIDDLLEQVGAGTVVDPDWLAEIMAGLPLAALILLQALALIGLRQVRLPSNQRWTVAAGLLLAGVFDGILAWYLREGLVLALPVAAVGLETAALAWHLARRKAGQGQSAAVIDPYDVPSIAVTSTGLPSAGAFQPPWMMGKLTDPGVELDWLGEPVPEAARSNIAARSKEPARPEAVAQQTRTAQAAELHSSLYYLVDPPKAPARRPLALLPAWSVSGLAGGLLAALISLPIFIPGSLVALFDVAIIPRLEELQAPAYSPAELEGILRSIFPSLFWPPLIVIGGWLVVGLLIGGLWSLVERTLYLPLLMAGLARRANGLARPGGRFLAAGLLGVGMGLGVVLPDDPQPAALAFLSAMAVLGLSWNLPRFHRWIGGLAFVVGALGIAALAYPPLWADASLRPWLPAVYALVVGPCLGIASALFSGALPARSRPALRLGWLALLGLLLGLAAGGPGRGF